MRLTVIAGLVVALSAGCGGDAQWEPSAFRGTAVSPPQPKPEFVLATTGGEAFDFRRETAGHVTLLFFGYTNCPDICPVHLANLAAVLGKLPPVTANQVKLVFVTTDPARDTPEKLRQWLDQFDPSFVGLTGPLEEVNAIQRRLGLPAAIRQGDDSVDYFVGHAAQVIAYTTDNLAHVVYPFGTRQMDWAHDLPRLAAVDGD